MVCHLGVRTRQLVTADELGHRHEAASLEAAQAGAVELHTPDDDVALGGLRAELEKDLG